MAKMKTQDKSPEPSDQDDGEAPKLRLNVSAVGPRVGAYVIDFIICIIIVEVLQLTLFKFQYFTGDRADILNAVKSRDIGSLLGFIDLSQVTLLAVVEYVVLFLYFGLLGGLNKGQTIGQVIIKRRAVREQDGQPIGLKEGLLNAITKANLLLLVIDLIAGSVSQKNRPLRQVRLVQRLTSEVIVKKTS
jgi:uncharacterized RDD family membrane protein YckC